MHIWIIPDFIYLITSPQSLYYAKTIEDQLFYVLLSTSNSPPDYPIQFLCTNRFESKWTLDRPLLECPLRCKQQNAYSTNIDLFWEVQKPSRSGLSLLGSNPYIWIISRIFENDKRRMWDIKLVESYKAVREGICCACHVLCCRYLPSGIMHRASCIMKLYSCSDHD